MPVLSTEYRKFTSQSYISDIMLFNLKESGYGVKGVGAKRYRGSSNTKNEHFR